MPDRSRAALIAMPPRSAPENPASEPSRRPMAVLAPPAMTGSRPAGVPALPDPALPDKASLIPPAPVSVVTIPTHHGHHADPRSAFRRADLMGWPIMLTRIDHVGIACRDLGQGVEKYCSVFGVAVASREVVEEQGVREAMLLVASADAPSPAPGASYIQLLEPLAEDSPVGKFLARRGEGIHHIGYAVDDVQSALDQVGGTGVRLIDKRPRHGSLGASIAFLHPADLGGG